MKVAIMQPYFFPFISYFQLMKSVDYFIVLDDVNYIKKGWINRNHLKTGNQTFLFTIPITKASQHSKINSLSLHKWSEWKIAFLKTINISYKKAPFYDETCELIEQALSYEGSNLSAMITLSLRTISKHLSIECSIHESTSNLNNHHLRGEKRIIDIIKRFEAKYYHNPTGGIKLYNRKTFAESGIELKFIKTASELSKDGYFSIIHDLMLFGKETISEKLKQYELQ